MVLSVGQERCILIKRFSFLPAFYRQSLQIQHLHAELFHNATALRGINAPEDVVQMPPKQQELALKSMKIAQQGLTMTLNSDSYRENMKYGKPLEHYHTRVECLMKFQLSTIHMPPPRSWGLSS